MIEKIFIISFIVFSCWAMMWENMIFGRIRELLADLNENIQKPLYDCPICMQFWYGTAFYWIIWGVSVKEWLIVVFAGMGLNAILIKLFPPNEE